MSISSRIHDDGKLTASAPYFQNSLACKATTGKTGPEGCADKGHKGHPPPSALLAGLARRLERHYQPNYQIFSPKDAPGRLIWLRGVRHHFQRSFSCIALRHFSWLLRPWRFLRRAMHRSSTLVLRRIPSAHLTGYIAANDLINIGQSSLLSAASTVGANEGSLDGTHDGTGGQSGTNNAWYAGGSTVTFALNLNAGTGGSPEGYTISGVNSFAGWPNNDTFSNQVYLLQVATLSIQVLRPSNPSITSRSPTSIISPTTRRLRKCRSRVLPGHSRRASSGSICTWHTDYSWCGERYRVARTRCNRPRHSGAVLDRAVGRRDRRWPAGRPSPQCLVRPPHRTAQRWAVFLCAEQAAYWRRPAGAVGWRLRRPIQSNRSTHAPPQESPQLGPGRTESDGRPRPTATRSCRPSCEVMEKIVGELHERIDTLERPKKRATQKRKPAAK